MANCFRFKEFEIIQERAAQKVSTDSVLLGAWMMPHNPPKRILDIGAGNGLLALMAAQRWKKAVVDAIEIDNEAAEECRLNFDRSPWRERLNVINEDFLAWQTDNPYDLIVSNPPFFTETVHSPHRQRDLARNQDSLPLELLIQKASRLLAPDGTINIIMPVACLDRLTEACVMNRINVEGLCRVKTSFNKEPKLLMAKIGHRSESRQELIILRDSDGNYSREYIDLTRNFYLFLH